LTWSRRRLRWHGSRRSGSSSRTHASRSPRSMRCRSPMRASTPFSRMRYWSISRGQRPALPNSAGCSGRAARWASLTQIGAKRLSSLVAQMSIWRLRLISTCVERLAGTRSQESEYPRSLRLQGSLTSQSQIATELTCHMTTSPATSATGSKQLSRMPRDRLKRNCARPRLRRAVGRSNERVISANDGCSSQDADNRARERSRLRERLLRPEGGTRIEKSARSRPCGPRRHPNAKPHPDSYWPATVCGPTITSSCREVSPGAGAAGTPSWRASLRPTSWPPGP
jgi:hypothetical protein